MSSTMCPQHHRPVKKGRIAKPLRAPERYVRVNVDLRHGVHSAGAQSHLSEPKDTQANPSSAAAVFGDNSQSSQPLQLPDIDEVADVR